MLQNEMINPPTINYQHKNEGASEAHNNKRNNLDLELSLGRKKVAVDELTIAAAEDAGITIVHGHPLRNFLLGRVRVDILEIKAEELSGTGV